MTEKFEAYYRAIRERELRKRIGAKFSGTIDYRKDRLDVAGSFYSPTSIVVDVIDVAGKFGCGEDIEARRLDVAGRVEILGTLKCGTVDVAGSVIVGKDVYADRVDVAGLLDVEGRIVASKKMSVAGKVRCSGIGGGMVEAGGSLRVSGDIKCEGFKLRLHGVSTVGGILEADSVEVSFEESYILKIGAISISRRFKRGRLRAKEIRGKHVWLEGTEAEVVEGNHVYVGEDSRIGEVRYRISFDKHDKAVVERVVRAEGNGGEGNRGEGTR